MVRSKQILEDRLERPVRWFAYPFGGPSIFGPNGCRWYFKPATKASCRRYGGFVAAPAWLANFAARSGSVLSHLVNLELHVTGCLIGGTV